MADVRTGQDVTVSAGTVTANAGTNLNTSTLALETGGNLAGAATSLALIDDTVKTDDAGFTPATDKVVMVGAEVDDTGTDSVDEGDAGAVRMSANRNLYVRIRDNAGNERGLNIDANGEMQISGSRNAITAAQATAANLNMTEASAAAIKTSVEIIDDWDESDRAKVNLIAGQAAITAGAGSVAANTPRVTHASDDPAVTSLQLIDDVVYTDDTSTHATGTSKGALIMAAATPTDTSVNANDIGAVAMTTDRRLLVDASGVAVPVTDNSGSLSVDWNGTQPVTGSGNATGALRVELPTNGTGVIATVSAVTAISNALPAGTNLLGRTASSDETSTIYNATTALTPKFAIIDAASNGDNTILASVSSKKIRVLALFLVAAGTTTVRFESGASGTALTGQMNLIANSGFTLPYNPVGWFETAATTLLNLELSANVSVDGCFTYVEV